MVSIVIISYNTRALTLNCIRSIYKTYPSGEIIVIDNRSPDDTVAMVQKEFPDVGVIITPENKSYSNAVNIGMNAATSEFVIVCNADVEFFENSITRLSEFLELYPTIGVCSPQQQYPDGSWQYSFGSLPSITEAIADMVFIYGIINTVKRLMYPRFKDWDWSREVGYCDGAVLSIRKKAFDEIGGFDEEFTFYAEEADFCYRLKHHGWGVYFEPRATVMHIRGASSGAEMNMSENALRKLVASKVQFMRKHSDLKYLYWFISIEIVNYEIKIFLCSILILIRSSKKLQSKLRMFQLLIKFYREIE